MTDIINIDWPVIFHSKSYHSIFIDNGTNNESIRVVYHNLESIQRTNGFLIMLPTLSEYESEDKSQYFKKFPSMLKNFFDNKELTTLITTLDVFEQLIKENSRAQIFNFLRKVNKNIIIFGNSSIEKYLPTDDEYLWTQISAKEWKFQVGLFHRFHTIKEQIRSTENPFKNPILSGNALLESIENK